MKDLLFAAFLLLLASCASHNPVDSQFPVNEQKYESVESRKKTVDSTDFNIVLHITDSDRVSLSRPLEFETLIQIIDKNNVNCDYLYIAGPSFSIALPLHAAQCSPLLHHCTDIYLYPPEEIGKRSKYFIP